MDKEFVNSIIDRAAELMNILHETPASRITPELIGRTEASMIMMVELLRYYRDREVN